MKYKISEPPSLGSAQLTKYFLPKSESPVVISIGKGAPGKNITHI